MAVVPVPVLELLNTYISPPSGQPVPGWTDLTGSVADIKVRGLGWKNKRTGDPGVAQLAFALYNGPSTTTSTTLTLNGAINASVTTITPSSITNPGFLVGMVIQVDSEQMQVTTVGASTLTVVRGVNYTNAVSHNNAAAILVMAAPYNPRSLPGTYPQAQPGTFGYYPKLELGQFIRIRYAGLNSGFCMRMSGTSTLNVPSSGSVSQTLSEAVANGQVWTLTYQARANYDYQFNTDKVTLDSATSGTPTTDTTTSTPSYTNKWVTYTVTLTLTAASATANQMQVTFAPYASVGLGGQQYIEYRNITLTCPSIGGGANQIVNGTFTSGAIGATPTSWTLAAGSNGMTANVQNDSYISFYGRISRIEPQAFTNPATPQIEKVEVASLYNDLMAATLSPPPAIQHNVGTGALMTLALGYATRSWPGQIVDAGQLTPPGTSFDTYTSGKDMASRAIDEILTGEYGKAWFDRDGTFVFRDRNYEAKKTAISFTPTLTLVEGTPYDMLPERNITQVTNRVFYTFHPRTQIDPINPVFIATNVPIQIPAKTSTGPGVLTIQVNYHDLYGRACGADHVQQLIPWTPGIVGPYDFKVNEFQAGNGIDYTTNLNLTVSFTTGVRQGTITFSNNAIGPLWIQFLQVRGQAVVLYDPQVVHLGEGTQATGNIAVPTQPVNLDTVVVNGVTFTFVTALTPTAGQVVIGSTALVSMKNLLAAMTGGAGAGQAYANLTTPAPNTCTYAAQNDANNTILITFIETGTPGNAFTLVRTGTGGLTVSAAHLTGGASVSKTLFGLRDYNKDLAIVDDPVFVNNLATWVIYRYGYPFIEVAQVKTAFQEQLNNVDLMSIEVGDVFAISSIQLGMYNARHMVASIDYDIDPHAGARPLSQITFNTVRLDMRPCIIFDEVAGSVWDDQISVCYI